jgi:hypothetical protein
MAIRLYGVGPWSEVFYFHDYFCHGDEEAVNFGLKIIFHGS